MILLLGAGGYLGQAFALELRRRGQRFIPLGRRAFDYTQLDLLFDYVRKMRPSFVINAAGYVGRPNIDACESAREQTLFWNTLLPQTISRVCVMNNTPWGHISSAGVYCGAKVTSGDEVHIERDLRRADLRRRFARDPEAFRGFSERDEPNFSFRCAPCSFYCGTKALAEEAIRGVGQNYIWRIGLPFNERDEPRNLLSKLQHYPRLLDGVNSVSHVADFVRACLDLWEFRAPFGIYNVSNPGAVTTRQLVEAIRTILKPDRDFEFWESDQDFYRDGTRALRSECVLDTAKLRSAGVHLRPAEKAVENSLIHWQSDQKTQAVAALCDPA